MATKTRLWIVAVMLLLSVRLAGQQPGVILGLAVGAAAAWQAPAAACPQCQALADTVAALQTDIATLRDRIDNIKANQALLSERLTKLTDEAQRRDAEAQLKRLEDALASSTVVLTAQTRVLDQVQAMLNACNKACSAGAVTPSDLNVAGDSYQPGRSRKAECDACRSLEKELTDADRELAAEWQRFVDLTAELKQATVEEQKAAAEMNAHQDAMLTQEVASLTRGAFNRLAELSSHHADQSTRLQSRAGAVQNSSMKLGELRLKIRTLLDQLDTCNRERCGAREQTPRNTTGTTATGPTADGAACPDCNQAAAAVADLEARKAKALELKKELEGNRRSLDGEAAEIAKEATELGRLQASGGNAGAAATRSRDLNERRESFTDNDRRLGALEKDAAKDLQSIESELAGARERLGRCNKTCDDTSRLLWYLGAGGAVIGGALLGGGDGAPVSSTASQPAVPAGNPTVPPVATPSPTSPTNPAPPAPTPQTECSQSSGRASMTGTVRAPANFRLPTGGPVVPSPQVANLTLDIHSDCTGTITITYSNGWVFAYSVRATVTGTTIQLVSTAPFTSSQMFGVATSSTIEFTVNGNTVTGIETHRAGSLTEIVDWQGTRQ